MPDQAPTELREWTDKVVATVKEAYDFADPEKTVLDRIDRHRNILEVGSGMGRYTKLLPRVVGLEYSRKFLDYTRANVPGLFLRGDGFRIPIRDNVFDCVFSSGVLEHFEDKVAFVKESIRVCKPGGTVIVTVPAKDSPDARRYMIQVDLLNKPEDKDWRVYGPRMSDREMREILTESGLIEIEVFHLGTPLRGWKVNIKRYLQMMLRRPSPKVLHGLLLESTGFILNNPSFRRFLGDWIIRRSMNKRGNYLFTCGVKPPGGSIEGSPEKAVETIDDLLEAVVCPITHEPLRRQGDRLVSAHSKRWYPIVEGVPYLTPDDAVEG